MIDSIKKNSDLAIGIIITLFSCLVLFYWIPSDIETGLVESSRFQTVLGDAFAPTVAVAVLLAAGMLLIVSSFLNQNDRSQVQFTINNFKYLILLAVLFTISFSLMIWTGPALVSLASVFTLVEPDADYALLRDTAPWKYTGYMLGGTFMVATLIALMEGKFSLKGIALAVGTATLLVVLYDLPFDNILLPPNGDY